MKKVLVCALAVFFLMASCSTAFAATTTTTTTYSNGDNTKMTVTTTVAGATEGALYSFLVTDGEKSTDNVIVADQKTAGLNGSLSFSYTGKTSDVVGFRAYSGNNENAELTDSDVTRVVTVTYAGDEAEDIENFILPAFGTAGTPIPFEVFVPFDKVIESVTVDGENIWSEGSLLDADFADGATLTVTLADATSNEIVPDVAKGKTFWRSNGTEVLTVFAKVNSLIPGAKFGVVIFVNGEQLGGTYEAVNYGNDGSFAIQLINENAANEWDFTDKESVTAQVYYEVDGEVTYDDTVIVVDEVPYNG